MSDKWDPFSYYAMEADGHLRRVAKAMVLEAPKRSKKPIPKVVARKSEKNVVRTEGPLRRNPRIEVDTIHVPIKAYKELMALKNRVEKGEIIKLPTWKEIAMFGIRRMISKSGGYNRVINIPSQYAKDLKWELGDFISLLPIVSRRFPKGMILVVHTDRLKIEESDDT